MKISPFQVAVPSARAPPAGLMLFPPTAISTAVLTRMVLFSGLRKTSLALRAKGKWRKETVGEPTARASLT